MAPISKFLREPAGALTAGAIESDAHSSPASAATAHPPGDARRTAGSPDRLFRDAMSALASGVAVVTVGRPEGTPAGLLATSIAAYSDAPPSILLSVAHRSRSHPLLVGRAEVFGVHLLARDQEETARVFAGRADDKYAALDWDWDGEVPRLGGAVSYLRCRRSAVFDHYDHSVLIGDVIDGLHAGGEPLLWVRRRMNWRLSPEG